MELRGTVTLDDDTMDNLTEQIREEVIEDIKNNGNYSYEIEKYLKDCNFREYVSMIKDTVDYIISKTEKKTIYFDNDKKKWNTLLAISSIFKI